MRILIIEDEKDLRETLAEGLALNGYAVDTAEDGESGYEMISVNPYDLLILDLNLPRMDGMAVLSRLRKKSGSVRVLILSARDGIDDRVRGIDSGADDYMVKPFHFDELLARMRGLLRRRYDTGEKVLKCGILSIDLSSHEAECSGRKLDLRPKEYGILEYLMSNSGRFVSQEELIEHVWNEDVDPFISSVRVHVSHIRRKIAEASGCDSVIESAPGCGYMIRRDS